MISKILMEIVKKNLLFWLFFFLSLVDSTNCSFGAHKWPFLAIWVLAALVFLLVVLPFEPKAKKKAHRTCLWARNCFIQTMWKRQCLRECV